MNGQEDLTTLLDALNAIPRDAISKPNIPIKHFLHEAEALSSWAAKDQAELTSAGLDWALVLGLIPRIGALRQAESQWLKNRFAREQAQQEWDAQAPLAYALRDDLLRGFRFAFRRDSALLKRVSAINEGNGHIDMVQDLSDLSALGRDHPERLAAIRLDQTKLDQALNMADEMGTLLGEMVGERADNSEDLELRNRAFTHLKEAVDEIRDHGQYVFWNNPNRRDGYASQYHRSSRSSKPTAIEQSTPQPA